MNCLKRRNKMVESLQSILNIYFKPSSKKKNNIFLIKNSNKLNIQKRGFRY